MKHDNVTATGSIPSSQQSPVNRAFKRLREFISKKAESENQPQPNLDDEKWEVIPESDKFAHDHPTFSIFRRTKTNEGYIYSVSGEIVSVSERSADADDLHDKFFADKESPDWIKEFTAQPTAEMRWIHDWQEARDEPNVKKTLKRLRNIREPSRIDPNGQQALNRLQVSNTAKKRLGVPVDPEDEVFTTFSAKEIEEKVNREINEQPTNQEIVVQPEKKSDLKTAQSAKQIINLETKPSFDPLKVLSKWMRTQKNQIPIFTRPLDPKVWKITPFHDVFFVGPNSSNRGAISYLVGESLIVPITSSLRGKDEEELYQEYFGTKNSENKPQQSLESAKRLMGLEGDATEVNFHFSAHETSELKKQSVKSKPAVKSTSISSEEEQMVRDVLKLTLPSGISPRPTTFESEDLTITPYDYQPGVTYYDPLYYVLWRTASNGNYRFFLSPMGVMTTEHSAKGNDSYVKINDTH